MKLKKHHKDKYGRNITRRCDIDMSVEMIKRYLIDNGETEFVYNGVKFELLEDGILVKNMETGMTLIL